MAEAYRVDFDTANYHAPVSDRESVESIQSAREKLIQDNLVRYVGEYRLGEKFDEYYYDISKDPETGKEYFSSGDNLPIKNIYRKSITERQAQNLGVKREVAECIGFEQLEADLIHAPEGTLAIWVSPPGEKEDGYGGYSFTFIAQKESRKVRMIPHRNEFSYKEHNAYLSKLTGDDIDFEKDTQYLASPFIIPESNELNSPEDVLSFIGEQEEFSDSWRQKFYLKAQPIIRWYINLVKENASDFELKKALNALENFAISYRDNREVALYDKNVNIELEDSYMVKAASYVQLWGEKKPPVVRGSCGATGTETPTPMQMQQEFGKKERVLCCTCPFCKREVEAKIARGRIECPNCKKSAKWND